MEKKVTFNHGHLCEMLRMASDNELANVINDVKKIQESRRKARKEMILTALKNAIDDAIKNGYAIKFSSDYEDDYDYCIHINNHLLINIELEED